MTSEHVLAIFNFSFFSSVRAGIVGLGYEYIFVSVLSGTFSAHASTHGNTKIVMFMFLGSLCVVIVVLFLARACFFVLVFFSPVDAEMCLLYVHV